MISFLYLFLPFTLAFVIPPWVAPLYWLLALISEMVEQRLRGKVSVIYLWMLAANTAVVLATFRSVPGIWQAGAAAVFVAFLLICFETVFNAWAGLRVVTSSSGPTFLPADSLSERGPSAWGAPAPMTPCGETVRVLRCAEFAMGSPVICDYLFADGSLVTDCGASTGFTPDGRYFISPMPSRGSWGLLIFDRHRHLIHRCDIDAFWEIDKVDDHTVTGRHSPLTDNQSLMTTIDELIGHCSTEPMVDVVDLKVARGTAQSWQKPPPTLNLPTAPGPGPGPTVTLQPYKPKSLAQFENPSAPLISPRHLLLVNGESSGLLLSAKSHEFVWRDDAQAFSCRASTHLEKNTPRYYLWLTGIGWRPISDNDPVSHANPVIFARKAIALDARDLTIVCEMTLPGLSHDSFGRLDRYVNGGSYHIQGETFHSAVLYKKVPLPDTPNRDLRFESKSLHQGKTLVWHFLHQDDELSCGVFSCSLEGRRFDGLWRIEHRVSLDQRQVALVAYEPPPAIAYRIAILNAETESLSWVAYEIPDPHLVGFSEHSLHLIHLVGRLNRQADGASPAPDTSPELFDEDVPPVSQGRPFLRYRENSSLFYQLATLSYKDGQWHYSKYSAAENAMGDPP